MKRPRQFKSTTIWTAAALLAISSLCLFGKPAELRAGELADRVAEGVDFFHQGDFASAGAAFDEAGVINPDDPRVAFDRGCVYAVEGNYEDAITQFQKAATAEDAKLASRAQYNLGCLDVQRAEALLGDDPMVSSPDIRKKTVERLEAAIVHFRDALTALPEHADAQYNLEAVRLWLAKMEKEWKEADLKAQLEQQEVLDLIRKIDGSQRKLRAECKKLETERRSIFRRQEIFNKEQDQRELAMQINPLKTKIEAMIGGQQATADPTAQQATPQNGAPQFDPKEAIERLNGIANNSATDMNAAADRLAEAKPGEAIGTQIEAIDKLDQIYMTLAPYEELVKHAIDVQGRLLQHSQAVRGPSETEESTDSTTANTDDGSAGAATSAIKADTAAIDWADSAIDQRFVARYAEVIKMKAEQMLAQLPPPPEPSDEKPATDETSAEPPLPTDPNTPLAVPTAPLPEPGNDGTVDAPGLLPEDTDQGNPLDPSAASDEETTDQPPIDPEEAARKQQEQQIEALRVALTNAKENCPTVVRLCSDSADLLTNENAVEAIAPQEEALRLLEEMLPKNPDQEQQDQKKNDQSCNQCDNPNSSSQSDNQENQSSQNENPQQNKSEQNDEEQEDQQNQNENSSNQQDQQNEDQQQDQQQSEDQQQDQQQNEDQQSQNPDKPEEQDADQSQQNADQMPEGEIPQLKEDKVDQSTARSSDTTEAERRKIEALMLRVQARQKERDQIKAYILEQQYRPDKVEKDW